eukprot:3171563-Pyramimonas_sp.AAC.1
MSKCSAEPAIAENAGQASALETVTETTHFASDICFSPPPNGAAANCHSFFDVLVDPQPPASPRS